jgi:hypothetical protein
LYTVHDANISISVDGEIKAALELERKYMLTNTSGFITLLPRYIWHRQYIGHIHFIYIYIYILNIQRTYVSKSAYRVLDTTLCRAIS